ncbi:MAG: COX15/CtaA family protein [Actinomycetota bacterium]|nr:COX15/CtaA family protein [Actinomycetota bacterium]
MRAVKILAVASTIATFVLVAIGGLVRATKSGLGCGDDWPHCSGRLVPALEQRAEVIEFSHRLTAGVVVILLGALAFLAFLHYRSDRRVMRASVGAFLLVMFQALLGVVVVKLELEASSVVLHLATAMSLLAVLIYLNGRLFSRGMHPTDRAVSRRAGVAAGAVLLLLMVGSYVSGTGAGLAFPDWPLMDGRVVPDLSIDANATHFLHRALAAVVGVIVAVVSYGVIRRADEMPGAARLARLSLILFALEVVVGAANVWTELNAAMVTAHLALGAGIWTALVGMAVVTHPGLAAPAPVRVTGSGVVAEVRS